MAWDSLALSRAAAPFLFLMMAACSGEDERPPVYVTPVEQPMGGGPNGGDGDGDRGSSTTPLIVSLLDDDLPAPFCNILQEQRIGVAEEITEIQPRSFRGYVHPETWEIYYHTADHDEVMTLDGPVASPDACSTRVSAFAMEPETGNLYFECDDSDSWYDEESDLFAECIGQMYVSRDGSLLCDVHRDSSLDPWEYSFRQTPSAPIETFVLPESVTQVFPVQARPDGGFWLFVLSGSGYERYTTNEDGSYEHDLTFASNPTSGTSGMGILGADGSAYVVGQENLSDVIRRHTADTVTEVFQEFEDCMVRGQVAFMFTTP